jgi:serine/threonine protein phosphatase PrpC/CRP-like cAMP-binding protein
MKSKKINCWQYLKCGREPGGKNAESLGVCPAASDNSFDGINSGINGGRFCWAVAGTYCADCGEEVQGNFAQKRETCFDCRFYKLVSLEEGTANLRTKFLRFVFPDSGAPLMEDLHLKYVKAGTRFITQGSQANESYIIQRGACLVVMEKDGELNPIDHRLAGDIVGVRAVLTGEPHSAHYDAETDMELWILEKERFDNITKNDPDLLYFLTEIVADRFDSRRPTSERRIGRYVATDIIGRGGYSIVYRGIDSESGNPVAIKMLRHHMAMNPDVMTCFRNEARLIGDMDHDNIIKVYDIVERFRTIFIIMEYLQGESLAELLKRRAITDSSVVAGLLQEILQGLRYAHGKGVIHRDINPLNIIVQDGGGVKILDFGFACPIGTEDLEMGTIFYIPPEQIAGEPMDQRADIYSLGIMAYEMVIGKRPFPEENLSDLMEFHLKQEIPDPAKIAPDLPEELRTFILKACRCNPAERLKDVDEGLAILRPLTEKCTSLWTPPERNGKVETYGVSHRGRVKTENQDRYLIKDYGGSTTLIAVADGMGGASGGAMAATMMIERLNDLQFGSGEFEEQLADVVRATDMAIMMEANKNPSLEGMGTTVTGALLRGGKAYWFHVGDSRLYLLHNGELQQITKDQNIVQYYLDTGEITNEEAHTHPSRHFLEQNVGCGCCEPETGQLSVGSGDLLICTSDGLHDDLSAGTITTLIKSDIDIKEMADGLIEETLKAGARDNVTVVIAKV